MTECLLTVLVITSLGIFQCVNSSHSVWLIDDWSRMARKFPHSPPHVELVGALLLCVDIVGIVGSSHTEGLFFLFLPSSAFYTGCISGEIIQNGYLVSQQNRPLPLNSARLSTLEQLPETGLGIIALHNRSSTCKVQIRNPIWNRKTANGLKKLQSF